MAKRLTAARVKAAPPGVHGDQFGLRLRVLRSGARTWVWRGTVNGRRVDLGLGGYPVVTLAEARALALDCKRAAWRGDDPRTVRNRRTVPTFAEAVDAVIELHRPTWKNDGRTEAQWRSTLRDHALPVLGGMAVDTITTADCLRVVGAIWTDKPTVAEQVRTRIGAVMRWAIAEGHRSVDNPAGDALRAALPRQNGTRQHHRAVGHADVAGVLSKVRESGGWAGTKLALAFVALTATRANEVCGMTWAEVDGDTWTIPADRMKTKREHRVPLSRQALDVLTEARVLARGGVEPGGLVFPAQSGGELATRRLRGLLTDLRTGTTTHGLRSAFRDWAAESGVDRSVAEAALAHVVGGVEGAYMRTTLEDARKPVMQAWADYLTAY